ncbi:MAG: hypothetical protein ABSG91_18905, partial [Syntrophobacteraceae bacterium]
HHYEFVHQVLMQKAEPDGGPSGIWLDEDFWTLHPYKGTEHRQKPSLATGIAEDDDPVHTSQVLKGNRRKPPMGGSVTRNIASAYLGPPPKLPVLSRGSLLSLACPPSECGRRFSNIHWQTITQRWVCDY